MHTIISSPITLIDLNKQHIYKKNNSECMAVHLLVVIIVLLKKIMAVILKKLRKHKALKSQYLAIRQQYVLNSIKIVFK